MSSSAAAGRRGVVNGPCYRTGSQPLPRRSKGSEVSGKSLPRVWNGHLKAISNKTLTQRSNQYLSLQLTCNLTFEDKRKGGTVDRERGFCFSGLWLFLKNES